MTDAKYDKAPSVGIENALELLEERLENYEQLAESDAEEKVMIELNARIYELKQAVEIVKLNIQPK